MAEQEPAHNDSDNPSRAAGPGASPPLPVRAIQIITGPWTWRNLFSWIGVIALIFLIKGCIIDQYTIPTGSMEPTLRGDPRFFRGDRVLVNKWFFGARIPFTTTRLWRWNSPNRWDIVVFRAIEEDAAHPILIKRVVGLPGEHVHIEEGRVWINGEPVTPPGPLADILFYTDAFSLGEVEKKRQLLHLAQTNKPLPALNTISLQTQTLYAEMSRLHPLVVNADVNALSAAEVTAICGDVAPPALQLLDKLYVYVQPTMRYGVDSAPEFSTIPDNHYFLLGDNSAQSLDGRMYGWVPHNHLYGRAFAVWWPWPRRQDFTGFSYTWWGKSLLYGIPLLLISVELFMSLRHKSRV